MVPVEDVEGLLTEHKLVAVLIFVWFLLLDICLILLYNVGLLEDLNNVFFI